MWLEKETYADKVKAKLGECCDIQKVIQDLCKQGKLPIYYNVAKVILIFKQSSNNKHGFKYFLQFKEYQEQKKKESEKRLYWNDVSLKLQFDYSRVALRERCLWKLHCFACFKHHPDAIHCCSSWEPPKTESQHKWVMEQGIKELVQEGQIKPNRSIQEMVIIKNFKCDKVKFI